MTTIHDGLSPVGIGTSSGMTRLLLLFLKYHREFPKSAWISSRVVPEGQWMTATLLSQTGLIEQAGTLVRLTDKGRLEAERLEQLAAQDELSPKLYKVSAAVEFMVVAHSAQAALVVAEVRVRKGLESLVWTEPSNTVWLHDVADGWETKVPYTDMDVQDRTCQAWLTP